MELFFYGKENDEPQTIINNKFKSPYEVFGMYNSYWIDGYLKSLDKLIESGATTTKYKITIEKIEEESILPYATLSRNILLEYKNVNTDGYISNNFYLVESPDYKNFLKDEKFQEYKYFCLVRLEKPTNEFKKTNITSKIIESGRCVDVSVSRSSTNRDCYVVFGSTVANYNNLGIILFKDSSSYGMLKMALSSNLRFYKLQDSFK